MIMPYLSDNQSEPSPRLSMAVIAATLIFGRPLTATEIEALREKNAGQPERAGWATKTTETKR